MAEAVGYYTRRVYGNTCTLVPRLLKRSNSEVTVINSYELNNDTITISYLRPYLAFSIVVQYMYLSAHSMPPF